LFPEALPPGLRTPMSSTDSSSTETGGAAPQRDASPRGSKSGSAAAAAVALAFLALLVWGLNPRQPKLTPAPLEPPHSPCASWAADFVPSNLTHIPGIPLNSLPQAARNRVLLRLNMEPCSCGCKQSLAVCRAGNLSCPISPQASDAIVKQETAETGSTKGAAPARGSP